MSAEFDNCQPFVALPQELRDHVDPAMRLVMDRLDVDAAPAITGLVRASHQTGLGLLQMCDYVRTTMDTAVTPRAPINGRAPRLEVSGDDVSVASAAAGATRARTLVNPSRFVVELWAGEPAGYRDAGEYARVVLAVLACGTDKRATWDQVRDQITGRAIADDTRRQLAVTVSVRESSRGERSLTRPGADDDGAPRERADTTRYVL